MSETACPSCRATMQRRSYDRKPLGTVDLDLCFPCHVIWFDAHESTQLTPGAVIRLFGDIHEHRDAPPRPVAANAACPRCTTALVLTHDIQRTNRLTYHRCPSGCGRLTIFFQFLREKNFVRSLTVGEIAQLRATVAQVRCSSCGAPVDLAGDTACSHCRAPISILDADAVKNTLQELAQQERTRRTVDPAAAVNAALAGKGVERRLARAENRYPASAPDLDSVELVGDALDALMELFN